MLTLHTCTVCVRAKVCLQSSTHRSPHSPGDPSPHTCSCLLHSSTASWCFFRSFCQAPASLSLAARLWMRGGEARGGRVNPDSERDARMAACEIMAGPHICPSQFISLSARIILSRVTCPAPSASQLAAWPGAWPGSPPAGPRTRRPSVRSAHQPASPAGSCWTRPCRHQPQHLKELGHSGTGG